MSTKEEILDQLKKQLVCFLDELIETFPKEPEFVIFRIFVKDRIEIDTIMKYIVDNLCPLQDMVKKRDENFFLNNNILFDSFTDDQTDKVNYFKNLWLSGNLDSDDKEVLWRWFQTFIFLGNKFSQLNK